MIIFIHGMYANAYVWKKFEKYFNEKNIKTKSINLRDGLNLKKTCFKDYVDKVKEIVKIDDIVIGHSMGGLIIQKVAEEIKIKGGVAICPPPPKGIKNKKSIIIKSIHHLPKIYLNKPFKPSYSFCKSLFLGNTDDRISRDEYDRLNNESPRVQYEIAMNKIVVNEKKIDNPFLFIAAKKDKACNPDLVKKIAEKYNGEFDVFDCCHHIFIEKNWINIAERIYKFINSLN